MLDLKSGTVAALAGTGEEGLRDGSAAAASLAQPSGLALSANGQTLYLADSESSAVRAITLSADPQMLTLVGAGLFDFGWVNGDFLRARLQHPLGVAVDGDRILVADTYNSAIRELELAKHELRTSTAANSPVPTRYAFRCANPPVSSSIPPIGFFWSIRATIESKNIGPPQKRITRGRADFVLSQCRT